MISIELLLYGFVAVCTATLMLNLIYSAVMLEECRENMGNVRKYRWQLDRLIILKMYIHGMLCLVLLLHRDWLLFFINLPMLHWEFCEVFGSRELFYSTAAIYKRYMKYKVSLLYFSMCFVYYLYCFVDAFSKEDLFEEGVLVRFSYFSEVIDSYNDFPEFP